MDWGTSEVDSRVPTRRRFLGTVGGAIAAGVAGCTGSGGESPTTTSGSDTITIGLASPTSGTYIDIGEEEQRGFELAIDHLNDGGGFVNQNVFGVLRGNGVQGQQVESVVVDTGGQPEQAESAVGTELREGTVDALMGGVAGDVVTTLRDLSAEHGVPYFPGTCPLSTLAGEGCSPNTYRELFPSPALMRALGPALEADIGDRATYYQLTSDTTEGHDLAEAVRGYFDRSDTGDWQGIGNITITSGTTDVEDTLNQVGTANPEVVFCNVLGLDAVNVLTQASDQIDEDVTLVVPLMTQGLVETFDEWDGDIFGTMPWHGTIGNELTQVFDISYGSEYGGTPGSTDRNGTGVAQLIYGQTIVYAAAVERGDTTDPDTIRVELESSNHDLGLGREEILSCNHQATRPVPVVRGQEGRFRVQTVDDDAVNGCREEPATNCLAF